MTKMTATAFFTARLEFQTDVSDVHAAMESGNPGFVLIDSRSKVAWEQGHIPGAVHMPTAEIATRAADLTKADLTKADLIKAGPNKADLIKEGTEFVTYCWGPGCNGATRAALALAIQGYRVREMLGGVEYWVREGFPLRTQMGLTRLEPDSLTSPVGAACGC